MIEKIIKYEVKVSVPSSQASQHLKKFENVIYKAINQGQGMEQTDVVSIKGCEVMKTLLEMKSGLHRHQHRELFEKTLDDDEIEALIDKARESVLAIKKDKKRDKEEREQAKEVLDFIDDVEGIWDKKKSLHPSQVVSLMKIVAGTSSSNPAGWGWKTKGFSGSPSGKVPQDFSNEELTEGKGMSDTVIKTGALMTKRYIINKGQEGDVSAQLNGLASLILFAIAATDRG